MLTTLEEGAHSDPSISPSIDPSTASPVAPYFFADLQALLLPYESPDPVLDWTSVDSTVFSYDHFSV